MVQHGDTYRLTYTVYTRYIVTLGANEGRQVWCWWYDQTWNSVLQDVSCNEVTQLPDKIGDAESLRSLDVRKNLLVELPISMYTWCLYRACVRSFRHFSQCATIPLDRLPAELLQQADVCYKTVSSCPFVIFRNCHKTSIFFSLSCPTNLHKPCFAFRILNLLLSPNYVIILNLPITICYWWY